MTPVQIHSNTKTYFDWVCALWEEYMIKNYCFRIIYSQIIVIYFGVLLYFYFYSFKDLQQNVRKAKEKEENKT